MPKILFKIKEHFLQNGILRRDTICIFSVIFVSISFILTVSSRGKQGELYEFAKTFLLGTIFLVLFFIIPILTTLLYSSGFNKNRKMPLLASYFLSFLTIPVSIISFFIFSEFNPIWIVLSMVLPAIFSFANIKTMKYGILGLLLQSINLLFIYVCFTSR